MRKGTCLPFLKRVVALASSLAVMGCERPIDLTELVAGAGKTSPGAVFAAFRDHSEWTGEIELGGQTLPSITPPFPSEITFDVVLPDHAELEMSVGLLTERRIPRARVDFEADLEIGQETISIFRREVREMDHNRFHPARVDLGAWGGKPVRLTLRARPMVSTPRAPWADRILTAWGNPVIKPRAIQPLAESERPSFVVLLVDTLRADFTGAYGFPGPISPAIDRLALESVVFENCFANAPWTKPSVATLFTSLYPEVHTVKEMGLREWDGDAGQLEALPQEAETLAELLQEAGYDTAAFVSNPFVSPRYGFSQGFDVFERRVKTTTILKAARQWIDERGDTSAPFFLYLHFMDVHGPYDPSRRDFETIRDLVDPGIDARLTTEEYAHIPAYLRDTDWADDEERFRLRSWHAKYGAGVIGFDRKVGPFLDDLRNRGILDRTYVVFTSDHGEELMEHGGWNHGENLFDHQLHVPLLIRKPLSEDAGRRVDSLVSLIDLMPSLLSLARIDEFPAAAGRDISPLLGNEGDVPPQPVFASAVIGSPDLHGVRTPRQKLLWNFSGNAIAIYDLVADPRELDERGSSHDQISVELLKQYLREHMIDLTARGSLTPDTIPLTDELRDQLKALGYVR
ncbi:MAG TPA: sulfatase [Vicinamibacteria bacterium]|nr:sulfatase [Vicinamibacteria bacterium]